MLWIIIIWMFSAASIVCHGSNMRRSRMAYGGVPVISRGSLSFPTVTGTIECSQRIDENVTKFSKPQYNQGVVQTSESELVKNLESWNRLHLTGKKSTLFHRCVKMCLMLISYP